LLNRISYFFNAARFVASKHLRGYEVDPEPTFQPDELTFFKSIIPRTAIYLEYGSGGSTIFAARYVKVLVSVESDAVFKRAVARKIPATSAEIHLSSPYIGVTAEWGTPVFGRPTKSRIKRWKRYPQAPWALLGNKIPDTILVDGRMRVACALESLLRVGPETCLVVDDYADRNYKAIEEFANLISMHGRMAEFRRKLDFDDTRCRVALEKAYSDLR
jgi:hypothetical protein